MDHSNDFPVSLDFTGGRVAFPAPLPLRIVVVGDFTPGTVPRASSQGFSPIRVDREGLDAAIRHLTGRIELELPDPFSPEVSGLRITLPLKGIRTFRLERLTHQVEGLRDLEQVCQWLRRGRHRPLDLQALREQIARITTPVLRRHLFALLEKALPESKGDSSKPADASESRGEPLSSISRRTDLDILLELVDLPEGVTASVETSRDPATRIISSPAEMVPGKSSLSTFQAWIEVLEQIRQTWLQAIRYHPRFRHLESLWRGIRFLLTQTDPGVPLQIDLLGAPKEHLPAVLTRLQEEVATQATPPVSVILAAYAFSREEPDLRLLQQAARKALALQAPLITEASPGFLGCRQAEEIHQIPSLRIHFDGPSYIPWNRFRESAEARWVTLVFNRFVLRLPEAQECCSSGAGKSSGASPKPLWGSPIWLLGGLLIRQFSQSGWCIPLTRPMGVLGLEGLPVQEVPSPSGRELIQIPLETLLTESQIHALLEAGVAPAICTPHTDTAGFEGLPTAYRPRTLRAPEIQKWEQQQASLPYQLLASRLAHLVGDLIARVAWKMTLQEWKAYIQHALIGLLGRFQKTLAVNAVEVSITPGATDKEAPRLVVTVWPERVGLMHLEPIHLEWALPGKKEPPP